MTPGEQRKAWLITQAMSVPSEPVSDARRAWLISQAPRPITGRQDRLDVTSTRIISAGAVFIAVIVGCVILGVVTRLT